MNPIEKPSPNINQGNYSGGGVGAFPTGSSGIGGHLPQESGDPNLDWIKNIAISGIDIGIGFIPVVGDIKDWQEATTGIVVATGERLTPGERFLTAVGGLIPGFGGGQSGN